MSDRYQKLFAQPADLYAVSSPVIIEAGVLLKDTVTGALLAQVKFRSIAERNIKALTLRLSPLDTTGAPLGDAVEHQYLDLNVSPLHTFGAKEPISLPDPTTRGFAAVVSRVVYADNTIWEGTDAPWEPLPEPTPLEVWLGAPELVKQFRLNYGPGCEYAYQEVKDLWICSCGAVNHQGHPCLSCHTPSEVFAQVDVQALRTEAEERLELEAQADAEKERLAAEAAAAKAAKAAALKKKVIKIGTIAGIAAVTVIALVLLITKVIVPAVKYSGANKLLEAGQYTEAVAAFEALGEYRDAPKQVRYALAEADYAQGEALFAQENYAGAITAFKNAGNYKDAADRIPEVYYAQGEALFAQENYAGAITVFKNAGNYKDAAQKVSDLKSQILKAAKVRDTVYYGQYEQDDNSSNGKEDIQWIVLARYGGRLLLISQYVLDHQPYHTEEASVTWATCSLRTWLNGTFLNAAFSSEEQNRIAVTQVSPDKTIWGTDSGPVTDDKVFLLSVSEAERYFASQKARECPGTYSHWWLRSPGHSQSNAACVFHDGWIDFLGNYVDHNYGIRPALWIDLNS